MTLIKLPNGDYVNPEHVALITFSGNEPEDGGPVTTIHAKSGNRIWLEGDQREELAKLINSAKSV